MVARGAELAGNCLHHAEGFLFLEGRRGLNARGDAPWWSLLEEMVVVRLEALRREALEEGPQLAAEVKLEELTEVRSTSLARLPRAGRCSDSPNAVTVCQGELDALANGLPNGRRVIGEHLVEAGEGAREANLHGVVELHVVTVFSDEASLIQLRGEVLGQHCEGRPGERPWLVAPEEPPPPNDAQVEVPYEDVDHALTGARG